MHSLAQSSIKNLKAYSHCAQLLTVCNDDDFPSSRIQCAKRIIRKAENLNFLIPSNIETDNNDLQGGTMLHITVMGTRSSCEILEDLLNLGADFTIKNKHGNTALHYAFFKSYPSRSNEFSENQDHSFINSILSAHIKFGNPSNPCDNNGFSHLHIACMVNNAEAVEFFLQNGVDVNQVVNKDAERYPGFTPLHCAVNGQSIQAIEILLVYGADISIKNGYIMTPLHQLLNQKIELLGKGGKILKDRVKEIDRTILILLGIDILNSVNNIDSTGLSSFHVACTMQDSSKVMSLLERVKYVDYCVKVDSPMWPGYTALHFAAHCNIDTMKLLYSKGANLEMKNSKGLTPIDICIKNGHLEHIHAAVSLKPEWTEILFSDYKTSLVSFLFAMQDVNCLKDFLSTSVDDINMMLPDDSPLWPGYTPLHLAVSVSKDLSKIESNLKPIEELLNHGADVTWKDAKGSTPLHHAFRENKTNVINLLLQYHRSSANPTDKENLSHLHIACAASDVNLVKKILSGNDVDVNICYTGEKSVRGIEPGSTPLDCTGDFGIIIDRMLLQRGAKKCLSPKQILTKALLSACDAGDLVAVQRLLESGADLNAGLRDGHTPLHIALSTVGSQKVVDLLLQRGADPFAKDEDGETPLSFAFGSYGVFPEAWRSMYSVLKQNEELQRRMEIETGITMLHLACYMLDVEEVGIQLDRGVKVNARVHEDSKLWPGNSPLHTLVTRVRDRFSKDKAKVIAELLLENGADVTLANAEADTPIQIASEFKDDYEAELTDLFFKHYPDFGINPTDRFGITYLLIAVQTNNVEVVEKFLKHGVDVNQVDDCRTTNIKCFPLHIALNSVERLGETRIVDLLLSHGADVSLEDDLGDSAIHLAALNNSPLRLHLMEKVLSYGADINSHDIDGWTPRDLVLQHSCDVTAEDMQFFLKHGCRINVYNPVNGEGGLTAVLSLTDKVHRELLLEELIKAPDVAAINEMGRTILHNVVAVDSPQISREEYVDLFKRFERFGCDVEDQDYEGRTALHLAAMFGNHIAIPALFDMGADLNIVDSQGKSALSYAVGICVNSLEDDERERRQYRFEALKALVMKILELKYFDLDINQPNNDLIATSLKVLDITDIDVDEDLRREFMAAKSFTIGELPLSLGDFLSETNGVIRYSRMSEESCDVVDKVFESIDTEFKEILWILKLQHRKAVTRFRLMQQVSLKDLIGFYLPALCADNVLRFLSIADLRNVVAATNFKT